MLLPRVTPDTGGGTVILAEMGTNVLVRCAWPHALPPLPCSKAPGHGNFCVQLDTLQARGSWLGGCPVLAACPYPESITPTPACLPACLPAGVCHRERAGGRLQVPRGGGEAVAGGAQGQHKCEEGGLGIKVGKGWLCRSTVQAGCAALQRPLAAQLCRQARLASCWLTAPRLPLQALLLESVDRSTAREVGSKRGVGAGTDSYYEYLIKWVTGLVLGRGVS